MMELLISWCVTSSILLAVFLLLRGTVFRTLSPRVRYALWGVVLLRLLVPFQKEMDALVEGKPAKWELGVLKETSWKGEELVYLPEHDPGTPHKSLREFG